MTPERTLEWDWYPGVVPENVELEEEAYLETTYSFSLFRSRVPEAIRIERGASVYLGVMFDLGPEARVRIGRFSLLNGARIIADSGVSIGDFCLISWNVVLMDTERLPRDIGQRRAVLEALPGTDRRQLDGGTGGRPIEIGANVWIGFDACVFPGVRIGSGSIVGARSVVVDEVPPLTVVAGNPARPIRQLEPGEPPSPELQSLIDGTKAP